MLIRIGLALNGIPQKSWLSSWLKERNMMIFPLLEDTIAKSLATEPLDLIIASEKIINSFICNSDKLISISEDLPSILAITNPENHDSIPKLLAAGCEMAVPSSIANELLKDAIVNITSKIMAYSNQVNTPDCIEPALEDFAYKSEAMKSFVRFAMKLVKTDTSLLILGETGVGKEHLALAIHKESPRQTGPFIPINCAALPDHLLESELFGHEKGSFTGSIAARRGAFELAHNGVIFLDEIGDMPLHLQAKLLRVLQDKKFQKVGGEKLIKVNVRVIAATNCNLLDLANEGKFRKDLYYRLSVVSLTIPPLRNRVEDIPMLAHRFANKLLRKSFVGNRRISQVAMNALVKYDWPGNVRELMNVLERAIILGDEKSIKLEDLPTEIIQISDKNHGISDVSVADAEQQTSLFNLPWKEARKIYTANFEKQYIENLLKKYNGSISQVAKKAGVTTRALHQKITFHKIEKKEFK